VSTTQTHPPEVARAVLPTRPRLREEDGLRYGWAHAALVAAALAAGATGMPGPMSFALVSATTILGARRLGVVWRVGIALAAWAIWTGFLHHTLGQLTFTDPDLLRLAGLVVLATAGSILRPGRWDRLGR
jgi:hypothetical protein